MINFRDTFKNLLTTLLVAFLVCMSVLAQNNGLPPVINFSNVIVEEIVDQVVSQSVQVRRAAQYQKQRAEKPEANSVTAQVSIEAADFRLSSEQLDALSVYHFTIRGPPTTVL